MWENKRVVTLIHAPFFEAAFIIMHHSLYVYILLFHAPCS